MKKLTAALIAVFLFPASFALGGEHPASFPLGDITPDPSELEFAFHTTPESARPLDEYQMEETEGERITRMDVIVVIARPIVVEFLYHYFVYNSHGGSDLWEMGYNSSRGGLGGLPWPHDSSIRTSINSVDRFLHELGGTDEIPPNGIIR
ncbi:MAG: hypothetical protein ISN29_01915 [Gammaproteobacteria bacterium AqS3]|nr:hypothetical protein [Gammaproteobacteria bacterium AqS3]